MKYRSLGRTNIQVSEVGFGCEFLEGKEFSVVKAAMDEAFRLGINIFDVFMSEPKVRTNIGITLEGRREKAIIQGHLGALWENGQYVRNLVDMNKIKDHFGDLLERLKTDYIDVGMIHFVDTDEDFEAAFNGELIGYAQELRQKGVIKSIGVSSHRTPVARRMVETGLIDVLMFSLNPAFDLMPGSLDIDAMFAADKSNMHKGIDPERMALYQACERHGTAITVMKAYMAARLLGTDKNPFGQALTPSQCIHYALTRPAAASALIGCVTPEDLRHAVAYEGATDEERDFSIIFQKENLGAQGQCMYCNHCLPCPAYIDIAQVNKYLDLATASDGIPATVAAHYNALPARAEHCTACGACEPRCPFDVPVRQRMEEAKWVFGR